MPATWQREPHIRPGPAPLRAQALEVAGPVWLGLQAHLQGTAAPSAPLLALSRWQSLRPTLLSAWWAQRGSGVCTEGTPVHCHRGQGGPGTTGWPCPVGWERRGPGCRQCGFSVTEGRRQVDISMSSTDSDKVPLLPRPPDT